MKDVTKKRKQETNMKHSRIQEEHNLNRAIQEQKINKYIYIYIYITQCFGLICYF
jgi:hypothetical protein